jgi:CheY-like chemotaxis protein
MSARILIVDDEPHIRTVMRLALEGEGHQVREASSGEEALDLFTEDAAWDLVLLDERMPGIDGLETLRRLRRAHPDAIAIMVTAFASIELAVDAMKLGAIDFVRKPMTPETLRAAVDGALMKRRAEWPVAAGEAVAAAEPRPYEVGMFNGFRLRHASAGSTETEQRFDVFRHDAGATRRILVRFTQAVVAAAADTAERPLDEEQAFWVAQAALALVHYIWTHADVPPDGVLLVARASADLLEAARRARHA